MQTVLCQHKQNHNKHAFTKLQEKPITFTHAHTNIYRHAQTQVIVHIYKDT